MDFKVAVLLTIFNRKELSIRCISDLFNQKYISDIKLSVYVTDDGSTDGSAEELIKHFPQITIIHGNGSLFWNRGMWTAWNRASKDQKFDAYLWLNNDTFLYDNAIHDLIYLSKQQNHRSIIVGAIESCEKKGCTTYGGYVKGLRIDPTGEMQKIDYFNGNVVLVPEYVFNIVGNLDYKYRHSLGDYDYGLQASKKNIKSFLSSNYIGKCNRHEKLNDWCNPENSFLKRINNLLSPTGYNPIEVFYFEKKNKNIIIAAFHQFTLLARLLFPSLWVSFNHNAKP